MGAHTSPPTDVGLKEKHESTTQSRLQITSPIHHDGCWYSHAVSLGDKLDISLLRRKPTVIPCFFLHFLKHFFTQRRGVGDFLALLTCYKCREAIIFKFWRQNGSYTCGICRSCSIGTVWYPQQEQCLPPCHTDIGADMQIAEPQKEPNLIYKKLN